MLTILTAVPHCPPCAFLPNLGRNSRRIAISYFPVSTHQQIPAEETSTLIDTV
jgi:hypothetical protein